MSSKTIVYQVLPRLWGEGRFSSLDKASLEYMRDLGATHVWFTGVIRHATMVSAEGCPASNPQIVKGAAGSPYAITDYYDVNPYLADNPSERMSEFERLIKRTHAAGLKAIIDFVPNHVSRDYGRVGLTRPETEPLGFADDPSVHWKPANDFFYYPGQPLRLPFDSQTYYENPAKASGNCFSPSPSANDWYETIRLNYCDFHTSTWDKMLEIVRYWRAKGVDGFRCDMVEMVPWQFFKWLIAKIHKEFPDTLFIAEAYNKDQYSMYLNEVGFSLLYDKCGLYDSLRALVEGHGTAESVTWNWQFLGDDQPKMLNFLENHDEQRFASDFFGKDAARTFAALGAGLLRNTAPYMVYFGEEIGERGMDQEGFSGLDGRTTIFDWWKIDSVQRLVSHIHKGNGLTDRELALIDKWRGFLGTSALPAFSEGKTYDISYCQNSPDFLRTKHFACLRSSGSDLWLVFCNFSDKPVSLNLNIPMEALEYLGVGNVANALGQGNGQKSGLEALDTALGKTENQNALTNVLVCADADGCSVVSLL